MSQSEQNARKYADVAFASENPYNMTNTPGIIGRKTPANSTAAAIAMDSREPRERRHADKRHQTIKPGRKQRGREKGERNTPQLRYNYRVRSRRYYSHCDARRCSGCQGRDLKKKKIAIDHVFRRG